MFKVKKNLEKTTGFDNKEIITSDLREKNFNRIKR